MTAIPILPDVERRTQYSPVASTGPFDVGFAIYGDGSDYQNWIEVWLNEVKLTPITDWVLTSPSGTLGLLGRPITDAQVTLIVAATGTLQIVGAQRPRRTTQLTEGRGISADTFNRIATEEKAIAREYWDYRSRIPGTPPGDTIGALPSLAEREGGGAGAVAGYDNLGNPIALTFGAALGGGVSTQLGNIVPGTLPEFTASDGKTLRASAQAGYLFDSVAAVAAAQISAIVLKVRTANYYGNKYGGGALYVRVGSQPTHKGRIQSADGAWWELAESLPDPLMFGAVPDGTDTMDPSYWASDPIGHTKGDWTTATAFVLNDLVWDASTLVGGFPKRYGYRCLVPHTSGTFATDLAAGKWVLGAFGGTGNTQAFKDWWGYCQAKTNNVGRILPGTYRLDDLIAAAGVFNSIDHYIDLGTNGCTIVGNDREAVTLLIDEDVDWSVTNSYNRATHSVFGTADQPDFNRTARAPYRFRGIGFRGRWLHRPGGNNGGTVPNWAGPNSFNIYGARELVVYDCKITDIRGKAMRDFYLGTFFCVDNKMERCARGFIKANTTGRTIVAHNFLSEADDDAIDIQTQDSNVGTNGSSRAPSGVSITDNDIRKSETGIITTVSRNLNVSGNRLALIHSGGAAMAIQSLSAGFGDQPTINVNISDNIIQDPVMRYDVTTAAVLVTNAASDCALFIQSSGRTKPGTPASLVSDTTDTEGVYPGSWQPTALSFLSEETGNREHIMDVTGASYGGGAGRAGPAGRGITARGNKVLRTLPNGTYSSWGFGLQFNQAGYVDGTYGDTNFVANGIILDNDQRGSIVSENVVDGYLTGAGIYLRGAASNQRIDAFRGIIITHNNLRKLNTGIAKDTTGVDDHWTVLCDHNFIDLDPLHTNASRTSPIDGSWQSVADNSKTGKGIWLYQNIGAVADGNVFRNVFKAVELYSAGSIVDRNNTIYCLPGALGYNAGNKGIGYVPNAYDYNVFIIDATPSSATYGQVTTSCYRSAAAMPATGRWIEGAWVQNTSPTVTNNVMVLGWLRMPGRTSTANVLGTDWQQVGIPVDLNVMFLDIQTQSFSGGVRTPGVSLSTGNVTIDAGKGPLQYITNGGAYTITAPANDGQVALLVTNNGSAGATTFSGFTVPASGGTGDALDTTNAHQFLITIARINSVSTYIIKALQ